MSSERQRVRVFSNGMESYEVSIMDDDDDDTWDRGTLPESMAVASAPHLSRLVNSPREEPGSAGKYSVQINFGDEDEEEDGPLQGRQFVQVSLPPHDHLL